MSGSILSDGLTDLPAQQARHSQARAFASVLLRRISGLLPAKWVLLARRGSSRLAERLPRRWRSKVGGFIDRVRGPGALIERDYPAWVKTRRQADEKAEAAAKAAIAGLADPPLISVVMPVFNPPPDHLRMAVRSVQEQWYPRWELCIADDASTDPAVGRLLREMQARDPRIKVVWRERNGHISAASNSALQLATGPFVALLDHDDLLSPRALHEVAARIVEQPDVDVVFSDEDHIDDAGNRSHPYFKPGWNPELMLGQNLISHLGVFRRTLVERVGGFRVGLEGSQDWDLALRVVAETRSDRIVHIPMVLYHWRQGTGTHTFSEAWQSRCVASGRRAVHEFAARGQADVKVAPAPFVSTWSRVIHPVPVPEPLVSVIVAAGDPLSLRRCVDGLLHATAYAALEVLVARGGQGGDAEASAAWRDIGARHRVRLLHHAEMLGDAAPGNLAARQAAGSVIVLLNPHLAPSGPGWLREMVSHALRPGIGAVGAKLVDADGRIRHGGFTIGGPGLVGDPLVGGHRTSIGYFGHLQLTRNVTAVSGDCLVVRRDLFLEVGGLDGASLSAAFSDVDLCLKLEEKGYRNLWTPGAELSYDEARPLASEAPAHRAARFPREAAFMRERWGAKLLDDAYWNPNLSLQFNELALAPPRGHGVPNAEAA